MRISYRHKFLFIHVPKVAGSSIKLALKKHSYRPESYPWNKVLKAVGIKSTIPRFPFQKLNEHATATQLRNHTPGWLWSQLFKFAFVRNPWDRLVSTYHYMTQTPELPGSRQFVDQYPRFSIFVDSINAPLDLQKDFVVDEDGELLVDFVGRFETLEADFQMVCERTGIESQLPIINTSQHRDYRSYFTDPLAEHVGRIYHEDIKFFGYNFDQRKSQVA